MLNDGAFSYKKYNIAIVWPLKSKQFTEGVCMCIVYMKKRSHAQGN